MLRFHISNAQRSWHLSEDMPCTLGLCISTRGGISASDQALYSSDFCLLGTTSFSFLRLLGVLHLCISLVPKRQKNLTCPEHHDTVISIKVVTTKPPALCLWLEEVQELGREKVLSISQQVGAQMKKYMTFPMNKVHL